MASYCSLKSSFVPQVAHVKDGYHSSSFLNASINAIMPSTKRKFSGVVACAKNNGVNEKEVQVIKVDGNSTTSLKYSGEKPSTPILDTINYPNHMKNLSVQELEKLADELREEIVYSVSKTGGHLSSSLGVADLTVALHHVFATPEDKIIWDVGHQIGRGIVLKEGSRAALLGYGTIVQSCLEASELLQGRGISVTVADARFCKPLDGNLITQLAKHHEVLITVEEGSVGGFSSHVSHFLGLNGLLDGNLKWRAMTLPDRYIDHGAQADQNEEAGLTPKHIAATVLSLIGENKDALHLVDIV